MKAIVEGDQTKVGKNLTIQFRILGGSVLDCEWQPAQPRAPMPRQIAKRYKAARKVFLEQHGEHLCPGEQHVTILDPALASAIH